MMKNELNIYAFYIILSIIAISSKISAQINSDFYNSLSVNSKTDNREYFYSNKISGFYYGMTGQNHNGGWYGWTIDEVKVLNDYKAGYHKSGFDRSKAITKFSPEKISRLYQDNVQETFAFADSINCLLIEYKNLKEKLHISFIFPNDKLIFQTSQNTVNGKFSNLPFFLLSDAPIETTSFENNALHLVFKQKSDVKIFLIMKDIRNIPEISKFEQIIQKKKDRVLNLLNTSWVETSCPDYNKALAWNKINLDALITYQGGVIGIFAGLPWFNNYWGRDSFISLPGATFVHGNFEIAAKILKSFSKHQDTIPTSRFYGRIPNRITINETIYNTADGTSWFIIQSGNYFDYSADTLFLKDIYPVIKLATNAFLQNNCDENNFLLHEDAETWMDAVGPDGPWSPRGNRANDIQALWYNQLIISSKVARVLKDNSSANYWEIESEKLRKNFNKYFIKGNTIADHLKKDNSKSMEVRPNLFYALNTPGFIDNSNLKIKILTEYCRTLVTPFGAFSLSPLDRNFHPFHHYEPFYVQDAAYHNGIIWLWNSGAVISSLLSFNLHYLAYQITENLVKQTLDNGAIGCLPELLDAFPIAPETIRRNSGTFVQAWSMAEFIRNNYQDYLGINPAADKKTLYLLPSIPDKWNYVNFSTLLGKDKLYISYKKVNGNFEITIDGKDISDSVDIGLSYTNLKKTNFSCKFGIIKGQITNVKIEDYASDSFGIGLWKNNIPAPMKVLIDHETEEVDSLLNMIQFANPKFDSSWSSIKPPDYTILNNYDIKKVNKTSEKINLKKSNFQKYDYIYPLNPNFKPGILELENFDISQDDFNYYFNIKMKSLNDPGWHSHFGFQLTLLSIAIKNESENGNAIIGLNSFYRLNPERAYNKLIIVGGGIELMSKDKKVIAKYIPKLQDISNPLGNSKTGIIYFSLPKKLIGKIDTTSKITILVGAQDDHGGAGIGEFRTVQKEPGEWMGGGKKHPESPNIYQLIEYN